MHINNWEEFIRIKVRSIFMDYCIGELDISDTKVKLNDIVSNQVAKEKAPIKMNIIFWDMQS